MKTGTWTNHNDICKFQQVLIINRERCDFGCDSGTTVIKVYLNVHKTKQFYFITGINHGILSRISQFLSFFLEEKIQHAHRQCRYSTAVFLWTKLRLAIMHVCRCMCFSRWHLLNNMFPDHKIHLL